MQHPFSGEYEAFNIGTDEYHTMEEVARMVVDECNRDYTQIKVTEPPTKFLSLSKEFSINKIRSIGYQPRISLKEGIKRVVEWQKKYSQRSRQQANFGSRRANCKEQGREPLG
jgi:nucleoside-diphosphate-sugar epimerase